MFAKSWSTGRAKTSTTTTYPGARSSASAAASNGGTSSGGGHTRQQHLDSYLKDDILGKSTMKISSDDTTYDTVFSTVSEYMLILRVHFPASAMGASARAPEMKLAGVMATHPWLDSIGRVTGFNPTSSDRTFRESGLTLGAVVKQVVQELQLRPPTIVKFVDKDLEKRQPPHKRPQPAPAASSASDAPPAYDSTLFGGSGSNGNGGVYVPQSASSSARSSGSSIPARTVDLPEIPSQFPALESMDRDELDELLNNEEGFKVFCNNLPIMRELDKLVADEAKEAAQLATENLSRQSELEELHTATSGLHEKLKGVVSQCKELERRQDALQEKPDPRVLIKELTKARKVADQESEKLADDWLSEGEKCADTMDNFCDTYLEQRKTYHMRAAKLKILERQSSSNGHHTGGKRL